MTVIAVNPLVRLALAIACSTRSRRRTVLASSTRARKRKAMTRRTCTSSCNARCMHGKTGVSRSGAPIERPVRKRTQRTARTRNDPASARDGLWLPIEPAWLLEAERDVHQFLKSLRTEDDMSTAMIPVEGVDTLTGEVVPLPVKYDPKAYLQ